jgi:hypothetical protein
MGRLAIAAIICVSAGPPSPASGDTALALGRGGAGDWTSGMGRGFRSAEEARSAALAKCGGEARRCVIVESLHEGCIAAAVRDHAEAYSVEHGHDLAAVREAALTACGSEAVGCRIAEAFCEVGGDDDTLQRANVQQLVLTWSACFTRDVRQAPATRLAACDKLNAFPNLGEKERARVVRRREELVKLRDDGRK